MEKRVAELINDQINKEFYSAYLYLDIANFYSSKGLDGFCNWYEVQAKEEVDHAMLFTEYMHKCQEPITLAPIAKPDKEFNNTKDPLVVAMNHEKYVTSLIRNIYAEADRANDAGTKQVLDWFLKEQEEEEENSTAQVSKIDLCTDDSSLQSMNADLGSRTYSSPSLKI